MSKLNMFSVAACGFTAACAIASLAIQAPLTTAIAVVYTLFFVASVLLLESERK